MYIEVTDSHEKRSPLVSVTQSARFILISLGRFNASFSPDEAADFSDALRRAEAAARGYLVSERPR